MKLNRNKCFWLHYGFKRNRLAYQICLVIVFFFCLFQFYLILQLMLMKNYREKKKMKRLMKLDWLNRCAKPNDYRSSGEKKDTIKCWNSIVKCDRCVQLWMPELMLKINAFDEIILGFENKVNKKKTMIIVCITFW